MESVYNIKQVPTCEVNKLVHFINMHWKHNHSLAVSQELLNFQHLDKDKDCYNFLVAENKETGEYDALIGFIPVAQYDKDLVGNGDYWGAIWKIRDDIYNSELNTVAFFLWRSLFKLPYFHSYAAIGISDIARQIYKVSRIPVDYLRQYYLRNSRIKNYQIAFFPVGSQNGSAISDESYTLQLVHNVEWDKIAIKGEYAPFKTPLYFCHRFAEHPVYHYQFVEVKKNGILESVWTVRIMRVGDSSAFRIVDVLGKLPNTCVKGQLLDILYQTGAEYMDFMNFGLPEETFTKMGFELLDLDGETIVPNYFEPFEQRNVKIEIAYKTKGDNYVAFKADSDQDRPNIL